MTMLHLDEDMIERMEVDLSTKAQAAFVSAGVASNVYGCFSLDDLENQMENQLQGKLAVGVGYHSAAPLALEGSLKQSPTHGAASAARMTAYSFLILLAVPTGPGCLERYTASKLLTILRRSIFGTNVSGDAARTWTFVQEGPNITASTETMLYFTQLWQISMPMLGRTVG